MGSRDGGSTPCSGTRTPWRVRHSTRCAAQRQAALRSRVVCPSEQPRRAIAVPPARFTPPAGFRWRCCKRAHAPDARAVRRAGGAAGGRRRRRRCWRRRRCGSRTSGGSLAAAAAGAAASAALLRPQASRPPPAQDGLPGASASRAIRVEPQRPVLRRHGLRLRRSARWPA
jgi:hypothetical protein